MTDTSFAIADLQSRWHTLNDLDRAQAIKVIHQSGVSLRNLASRLNCSPSLLTHLLQAALKRVLGPHVAQKGSQVSPEHLRFDFSHPKAVTPDELQRVEVLVNAVIRQNTDVATRLMPTEQAISSGAMALFGLIFAATNRRLPKLNWMIWVLVGVFPIGLDGFSQLFSQIPSTFIQSFLPYRESTPFLRVLTGFLFGFATAWFMFPLIEETMVDTRRMLSRKFAAFKPH